MIKAYNAPSLRAALGQLKKMIAENEQNGKNTFIFCEDRLTLAAERAVCQAVGGTFSTCVYTFARFLSSEKGKPDNILSSQGSAMAIRKLVEENRENLSLFKRLSSSNAAQEIYDTIALLYSSRVTAEDLGEVRAENSLLAKKLGDLALLYREYSAYLKENGCIDRNSYLRTLPDVIRQSAKIRGAEVIFLGFQSFTCSVAECARACMQTAKNVSGLFIGGNAEYYTNEALASFTRQAADFGSLATVELPSDACAEAEQLRKNLFNPACFHSVSPLPTPRVRLFEAADEQEEMEYIAANIIRHVCENNVRFQSISVMLPDVKSYQGALERVFSEYGIPYYADRRYSLSEHPVSAFIGGYLSCAADGCAPESVSGVVSSPLFSVNRKDKDIFANYILRLAAYRGGVKRQPKEEVLKSLKFDGAAIERVRGLFFKGLKLIPSKARGEEFCAALKELLLVFRAEETLNKTAEDFKDEYPSLSALSARAYEGAVSVLDEAGKLTYGMTMTAREFSKILKSGFSAAEISLIPPKQDAVFVGDLGATANIGTEVLFAAGLTEGVPAASQDAAILTDRELSSLEKLNVVISPKIMQVNMRTREMTALNLCAFKCNLYLTYPVRRGGEESCAGEVISYAEKLFASPSGNALTPMNARQVERSEELLPYYSSRPLPAVRRVVGGVTRGEAASSVYAVLKENGYEDAVRAAFTPEREKGNLTCGKRLYGESISPTALETYFSCPYKSFMRQGLRLNEREEGLMRPLDSGNFIHAVLQKLAYVINGIQSQENLEKCVRDIAENLLLTPKYAFLNANKRGQITAASLIGEAVEVSSALYEQLKNSNFGVSGAEQAGEILLDNGLKLFGRIDRVDSCGDMVRIIDYKTGAIDGSAQSYYMGLKLQLPLYLLSASKGKRAVGAYYFPAQTEYREEKESPYRMKGFMDGGEDVVKNSDTTLEEKQKSNYFDAYLNGRKLETAMSKEDFADFLVYSTLVARKGGQELLSGNVSPSPSEHACSSCRFSGSCGFAVGVNGEERKTLKTDCGKIARIVRKQRGDEE